MKDESEADAGAVRCGAVRSKVRIGMLTEKVSYMAYHIPSRFQHRMYSLLREA